jgi:hypothetical protein
MQYGSWKSGLKLTPRELVLLPDSLVSRMLQPYFDNKVFSVVTKSVERQRLGDKKGSSFSFDRIEMTGVSRVADRSCIDLLYGMPDGVRISGSSNSSPQHSDTQRCRTQHLWVKDDSRRSDGALSGRRKGPLRFMPG